MCDNSSQTSNTNPQNGDINSTCMICDNEYEAPLWNNVSDQKCNSCVVCVLKWIMQSFNYPETISQRDNNGNSKHWNLTCSSRCHTLSWADLKHTEQIITNLKSTHPHLKEHLSSFNIKPLEKKFSLDCGMQNSKTANHMWICRSCNDWQLFYEEEVTNFHHCRNPRCEDMDRLVCIKHHDFIEFIDQERFSSVLDDVPHMKVKIVRKIKACKHCLREAIDTRELKIDHARLGHKKCPECAQWIEKDGGCLHMTCTCSHEFYWCCLRPYRNREATEQHKQFCPSV